ncbi:hypothetical protein EIP91_004421 [Steccherinum ochraceum]|uniref:Sulfite oxidase n=1 Tax=Steccherinum ochraceum TaxID=92696 RepID=A0A4R0RN70_9APHY|nr:hypothetical protein EIP91_004421 [Steccherinum ochraceum]
MDFSNEPAHSEKLNIKGEHPFNAEPQLAELVKHPLTPEELMYCRSHCPVKTVDPASFKVTIDGPGGLTEKTLSYTLADLQSEFQKVEVVAALQCAGNRRKHMAEKKHQEVEGLKWDEGTICNVKWGGVRMVDLLLRAGVRMLDLLPRTGDGTDEGNMQDLHLCFASHVSPCEEADWFGGSIPLRKAMDPEEDVLLAYEVNGKPLSPDHGGPFRVVVPGHSGVRWVKWVERITVSTKESDNYYQQKDYKILPPDVTTHDKANDEAWWSRLPALQSNTLNSAVASAELSDNNGQALHVKGYAVPGASGQVKKVEVSTDGGKTWTNAKITYQEGKWSWTLWEATLQLSGADIGEVGVAGVGSMRANGTGGKVISRAMDQSGNVQRFDKQVPWNLRGVGYDAVGEKLFEDETLHRSA